MKITKEHREQIRLAMAETLKRNNLRSVAQLEQVYRMKGIGKDHAKRARWDIFNASTIAGASASMFLSDHVYSYAHDAHVDSVLRSVA